MEEREQELVKREETVRKREQLVEEATRKCDNIGEDELVTYNVGGQLFMYPASQIQAHPESMLACFISERWNKRGKGDFDPKECIYTIPRSSRLFRYIDDFLRGHEVAIDPQDEKAAADEFLYYGFHVETKEPLPISEWVNADGTPCGITPIRTDIYTRFRGSIGWEKGIHTWILRLESSSGQWYVGIVQNMKSENGSNSHSLNDFGRRHSPGRSLGITRPDFKQGTLFKFTLDLDRHTLYLIIDDDPTQWTWENISGGVWHPYLALITNDSKFSLVL